MINKNKAIFYAVLAAGLYALNAPISKLLLVQIPSTMMAGLLYLGAAKTSTYYAISPFIGAVLSLIIFTEPPSVVFIIALAIMAMGTYFASTSDN